MDDLPAALFLPLRMEPSPGAACEAGASLAARLTSGLAQLGLQGTAAAAGDVLGVPNELPLPTMDGSSSSSSVSAGPAPVEEQLRTLLAGLYAVQPMHMQLAGPSVTAGGAAFQWGEADFVVLGESVDHEEKERVEAEQPSAMCSTVLRKGTAAWYHYMRHEPVVPGSYVSGEQQQNGMPLHGSSEQSSKLLATCGLYLFSWSLKSQASLG